MAQEECVPMRVATFNILCSACTIIGDKTDDYDNWHQRLEGLKDVLARHTPDIVGIEELIFSHEVDKFKEFLPHHEAVFYKNWILAWPDATILYDKDKYTQVDTGFFWLSNHPDIPFTRSFGKHSIIPRLVAWAHLRRIVDGREFVFAATHFDNNTPAQAKSAPLVLERLSRFADLPVFFVGDMNSRPNTVAYRELVQCDSGFCFGDTYNVSSSLTVDARQQPPPYPFNYGDAIDHILYSDPTHRLTVSSYVVDEWTYGDKNRFPSDHRYVHADVCL
eukprot:TRINITY_DN37114_c0_g1_i1.p1 TRINITY_DN37114_c0_g1~~TRINITY_DN37114_c0_g1_i1.p1  ORF type:complete len:295 (-),score=62.75 TRINITY_DN37114_c0_g1_i1:86-916(-)